MKSADFEGFGVDDDGTPVMAFSVEMADGRDLDGKLEYRISAIRVDDDEGVVALVPPAGPPLQTLPWSSRLSTWFDRAIDERGYLAVTTYENLDWEHGGGHALALLGGENMDEHTERVDLDDQSVRALEQIREHFEDDEPDS